jgi:microcystin-dependent protein
VGEGYTPPGVVQQYAGSTPPLGYFICDGAAVSRTTYSALFTVVGITYGPGDGITTFNLPNLQGKIPVGQSGETEFNALGKTGGEKTHVITTSEMASHLHSINGIGGLSTSYAGTHSHGVQCYSGSNVWGSGDDVIIYNPDGTNLGNYRTTSTVSDHYHSYSIPYHNTNSTGNSSAHNNLQPYIVLNYIIKY